MNLWTESLFWWYSATKDGTPVKIMVYRVFRFYDHWLIGLYSEQVSLRYLLSHGFSQTQINPSIAAELQIWREISHMVPVKVPNIAINQIARISSFKEMLKEQRNYSKIGNYFILGR